MPFDVTLWHCAMYWCHVVALRDVLMSHCGTAQCADVTLWHCAMCWYHCHWLLAVMHSCRLSEFAKKLYHNLGSALIQGMDFRDVWSLVGQKGIDGFGFLEQVKPPTSRYPTLPHSLPYPSTASMCLHLNRVCCAKSACVTRWWLLLLRLRVYVLLPKCNCLFGSACVTWGVHLLQPKYGTIPPRVRMSSKRVTFASSFTLFTLHSMIISPHCSSLCTQWLFHLTAHPYALNDYFTSLLILISLNSLF